MDNELIEVEMDESQWIIQPHVLLNYLIWERKQDQDLMKKLNESV